MSRVMAVRLQEVTLSNLTMHERQQVESQLREYDLDLSRKSPSKAVEGGSSSGSAASRRRRGLEGSVNGGSVTFEAIPEDERRGGGAAAEPDEGPRGGPRLSSMASSSVGSMLAGGAAGGKMIRSRSLSDLDMVHKEYANSSLLFSLRDIKVKKQTAASAARRESIGHHVSPVAAALDGWVRHPLELVMTQHRVRWCRRTLRPWGRARSSRL